MIAEKPNGGLKMKKHYAVLETPWPEVYAFKGRKTRDQFCDDTGARPIKRNQVSAWTGKPEPFSGKSLVIDPDQAQRWGCNPAEIDGLVGAVIVNWTDDPDAIDTVY